jgi:cbb3-type cytochrome oxidase maturation protein
LDILYLLIPLSAVLVLVILGVFAWATYSGQFDDVEQEGRRILASGEDGVGGHQAGVTSGAKES